MTKIYCFIFARKGSKRLKNKNLKSVNSRSLLLHSIKLAKKIKIIDKIFVSSDCPKILNLSKKENVYTIIRPKILAADKSNELVSWTHAIKHVIKNFGNFDIFLSLPTTSPLRSKKDVKNIIKSLNNNFDLSIGVTPSLKNPYFNMVSLKKNNKCDILISKKNLFRSQDAPLVYDVTTVAYVSRPQYIISLGLKNKNLFSGRVVGTKISRINSVDIDNKYDLELANFYYKRYKKNEKK